MRAAGCSTVSEFLGADLVFRNLVPVNRRLTRFSTADEPGLRSRSVPRKMEPAYGSAVCRLLREARSLTAPDGIAVVDPDEDLYPALK